MPIIVRSDWGHEVKLSALIDTGSNFSAIDESLAHQLQLVPMRQETVAVLNQPILITVYRAEIEIPALGIREWAAWIGGLIRGKQQALLGRSQILSCEFVYSGPSGRATLSKK